MKKILIISIEPYKRAKSEKYFYQSDFESIGYEFHYWCLADCRIYNRPFTFNDEREHASYVTYFDSLSDVLSNVKFKITKEHYCFFQIPLVFKTNNIFRNIIHNANKCFEIKNHEGFYHLSNVQKSTYEKIKMFANPIHLCRQAFNKIFYIYTKQSKLLKKIIYFYPGSFNNNSETSLNFVDYNDYLISLTKTKLITRPYILFLDQSIANHPDFEIRGLQSISKSIYLKKINYFFEQLEKTFLMDVVIAAHPKSDYQATDFNNRKIIKHNTAILVRDSSFVVKHLSASLSYAILNYKPICYIYSQEFLNKESYLYDILLMMQKQSEFFDSSLVSIDKEELQQIPTINKDRYDLFLKKYIFSMNPNKSNFEIIKQHIQ